MVAHTSLNWSIKIKLQETYDKTVCTNSWPTWLRINQICMNCYRPIAQTVCHKLWPTLLQINHIWYVELHETCDKLVYNKGWPARLWFIEYDWIARGMIQTMCKQFCLPRLRINQIRLNRYRWQKPCVRFRDPRDSEFIRLNFRRHNTNSM